MTGANVNQMLSFMQETIQVQQNAIKSAMAAENSKTTDFSEFMKATTTQTDVQGKEAAKEFPAKQGTSETTKKWEVKDNNSETAKNSDVETYREPVEKTQTETSTTTEQQEVPQDSKIQNEASEAVTVADELVSKVKPQENVIQATGIKGMLLAEKTGQLVGKDLNPEEPITNVQWQVKAEEGLKPVEVVEDTQNPELPQTETSEVKAETVVSTLVDKLLSVTGSTEDSLKETETPQTKEDTMVLEFGNVQVQVQFTDKQEIEVTMPQQETLEEAVELQEKVVINVEMPEDLQETLQNIKSQLVEKIADNFDVTEEEVEEAMETLAIQMFDLLQADTVKQLAVYISGEESLVSMVTNEQLFTAYQEVEAGIEEIALQLPEGLEETFQELGEAVEQFQTIVSISEEPAQEILKENIKPITLDSVPEQSQEDLLTTVTDHEETQIPVEVIRTEEPVKKTPQTQNDSQQPQVTVEKEPEYVGQQLQKEQSNSGESGKNNSETGNQPKTENAAATQTTTNVSTIVTETEVQTVVRTQQTDFEGIVRQIVEQVKVQIKPDTVAMELQLNPESLGKVNLHVSSKEGAVTAQLFVQNETVKNAIEGQLMVLRETMQQQGIKVEAVEVTVETGNFGRNLNQQSEQQKQENEQKTSGYQHRGINLLAGVDEEVMNEDELLRAHLMRESGNSVDMNA